MIQNFWSWLHSNSFYNPSKILGTPKWRKLGNPVKPKILARFQKNLVHFHISPGAISRQGIAKIADIGLIFTLITQRTAPLANEQFDRWCTFTHLHIRKEVGQRLPHRQIWDQWSRRRQGVMKASSLRENKRRNCEAERAKSKPKNACRRGVKSERLMAA